MMYLSFSWLVVCWNLVMSESWTGSRLGTQQYNKELEAISRGIEDRAMIGKRPSWRPYSLLCVTFTSSSINTTILADNIAIMGDRCAWAVIFYDENESEIKGKCSQLPNLVHCRMFPLSRRVNTTATGGGSKPLSIPKTVLYTELLPYLPLYEKVFLMDEDISLVGFNITTFTSVWECAFGVTPPLIVQPLIAESNQYIPYVNVKAWKGFDSVWASEVGLVEQQVPMFDSAFFEWFVRRVLSQTYSIALKYGVDWGHDRSWCNAAHMYSTMVLGQHSSIVVCAVLVKSGSVHHLNGHTMAGKRANRLNFHHNGVHVVQHYVNLFPTWVLTDVVIAPNPLIPRNEKKYKRVLTMDQTCLQKSKQ